MLFIKSQQVNSVWKISLYKVAISFEDIITCQISRTRWSLQDHNYTGDGIVVSKKSIQ